MYLISIRNIHHKTSHLILLLLLTIGTIFSQYSTDVGAQSPSYNSQQSNSGGGAVPGAGGQPLFPQAPAPSQVPAPAQGQIPSGNANLNGNLIPGGNGIHFHSRWSMQSAAKFHGGSSKSSDFTRRRTCQSDGSISICRKWASIGG